MIFLFDDDDYVFVTFLKSPPGFINYFINKHFK